MVPLPGTLCESLPTSAVGSPYCVSTNVHASPISAPFFCPFSLKDDAFFVIFGGRVTKFNYITHVKFGSLFFASIWHATDVIVWGWTLTYLVNSTSIWSLYRF